MKVPNGAMVAVVDGEKLHLFRSEGDEAHPKLTALPEPTIKGENKGSGHRHESSSSNPDDSRLEEDSFAAASAAWLNKQVLDHKVQALVVIAAPKTLGELRKHFSKQLQAVLAGELSKDLTGSSAADIATALAHA